MSKYIRTEDGIYEIKNDDIYETKWKIVVNKKVDMMWLDYCIKQYKEDDDILIHYNSTKPKPYKLSHDELYVLKYNY